MTESAWTKTGSGGCTKTTGDGSRVSVFQSGSGSWSIVMRSPAGDVLFGDLAYQDAADAMDSYDAGDYGHVGEWIEPSGISISRFLWMPMRDCAGFWRHSARLGVVFVLELEEEWWSATTADGRELARMVAYRFSSADEAEQAIDSLEQLGAASGFRLVDQD